MGCCIAKSPLCNSFDIRTEAVCNELSFQEFNRSVSLRSLDLN